MRKVKCSVCKKIIERWLYQVKSQNDFYCDEHKKHMHKGKHNSPSTEFKKGKHYSINTEFKKGQSKSENWYKSVCGREPWNKGLTIEDTRILKNIQGLLSVNVKGVRRSPQSEFKKGLVPWNKGLEGFLSKEQHWNWQGGITTLHHNIRTSAKYIQWQKSNLVRDNYTCQICKVRGGILHVDHYPKPFSQILKDNNIQSLEDAYVCDELWNLNIGRTLCVDCHKKYGWSFFKENNPRKKQAQGGSLDFVYRPRYL